MSGGLFAMFTCGHHGIMTGQFLSGHIAVKQVEGKMFRPRRSSSITILYCNWWRPSQSKCFTFNLFYCYVSAQELPSHTFAVAMSLYQITMYMHIMPSQWWMDFARYTIMPHTYKFPHYNDHKIQELGYVVMKQYEITVYNLHCPWQWVLYS